ncbi:patatin-like phospholipase family protein [Aromatoleum diolicum]|uniref:Patatin-like phospholipase family protein n=1 Tax=Aromatoleum diolicum TaxID=75796 RepID=A0ABX1Q906_9RHOO|nr:patatin-like phospholipase family protein [Aromatoleum diolicum]NMG73992.1 patatin-like phospholipase family protein [Aromatoleum diolicum]
MRKKLVTLALQGGGSHGAFTWGVLDRLLEDERIDIDGISGASAGAMNAVLVAHGFTCGGRDGARQALKDFWESVETRAPFNGMGENASSVTGNESLGNATALKAFLFMTRFFSPYQLNPFDLNPLRDILVSQVDFERLRADCRIELFIAATRVSTGRLRLFHTRELTLEALLASACLPALHHSIEIDGEAYWDGGLTANPPLIPLVNHCRASDLIMVLLHPEPGTETPSSADEISRRLTEIGFTSAFFTELQGLAFAKEEAEQGWIPFGRLQRKLRRLNMHLIDSPEYMSRLGSLSKANTHSSFIAALHDEGRSQAESWLENNFQLIGSRSSCRLDQVLR